MLLTLPWLFALAARVSEGTTWPSTRRAVVALGVMAGVGFALKPFFLLAWLLPEALHVRRAGVRVLLRPESVALVATVACYGVAVLLLEPDYLRVARLAAITYHDYYPATIAGMLRQPGARLGLIALAAWLGLRPFLARRGAGDVIALAAAGFLAGVFVQGKGWGYHWIASTTLAWLLFAAMAMRVLEAGVARTDTRAWLAPTLASAFVGVGLAFSLGTYASARQEVEVSAMGAIVRAANAHQDDLTLAMLSTQMPPAFPLVNYLDARWGLRFNSLWPLPALYEPVDSGAPFRYRPVEEMPPAERFLFEAVATDLAHSRPDVLIVDMNPPGNALRGFDYLAYFGRDTRVAALLDEYGEVPPVGAFRILVRRTGDTP